MAPHQRLAARRQRLGNSAPAGKLINVMLQSLRSGKKFTAAMLPGLIALACLYGFYSMNSGITITNDGSHFALFDALVTTGSPELKNVRQFAYGDSARYDDRFYSDRNPGLALTTVAFYQLTRGLQAGMKPLLLDPKFARNYQQGQKQRITIVMLVPALSGTLVFLLAFLLCRELGVSYYPALASALALVVGTIVLRYSTLFYSHTLASALLLAGLLLVFSACRRGSMNQLAWGFFFLSCAVLTEHLLILTFIPVVPYVLAQRPPALFSPAGLARVLLAGLLPMLVLMIYNVACFNSPFSIAHFHHSSDPQNHELGTLLRIDQSLVAAGRLLLGAPESAVGRQDLLGLFSASPFLYLVLLFPLAIVRGRLRFRAEHAVLISCIVLLILGGASVFAPYGGWDRDYRYFCAAIPLFAPFIGSVLEFLLARENNRAIQLGKTVMLLVFALLLVLSIAAQLAHLRHPGQIQYPHLLVNAEASIVNVSLLLALGAAVVAPVLLVRHRLAQRATAD